MGLVFIGLVFLLMGVRSPTILSLGALTLALLLRVSLVLVFRSWFRFVMFLLYIGGIIVVIIYFSTLVPNQQLKFRMGWLLVMGLVRVFLFRKVQLFEEVLVSTGGVESLSFYERGNLYISLCLLVFLFILIVLVVSVTRFFGAPLRPLNK